MRPSLFILPKSARISSIFVGVILQRRESQPVRIIQLDEIRRDFLPHVVNGDDVDVLLRRDKGYGPRHILKTHRRGSGDG